MEYANLGNDFAGCGEQQSGQRFLDSSDPRLIRHVASCETAGGGTHLPPAGKDEKLSREFEGGALIGREAPVPSSLDDSQTANLIEFFRLLARGTGKPRIAIRTSYTGRNRLHIQRGPRNETVATMPIVR